MKLLTSDYTGSTKMAITYIYILQLINRRDHRILFFSCPFLLGFPFPLFPSPPYPVYISPTLPFSYILTLSSPHKQFTLTNYQ